MEEGDGTGGVGQRGGLCGVDFAHETATTKLPQHHHLARSLARFSHSAFFRLSSSVSSKCGASGGCGYFLHLCTEYPSGRLEVRALLTLLQTGSLSKPPEKLSSYGP